MPRNPSAANARMAVHPHGTYGVIGAAIAVDKLKGFDVAGKNFGRSEEAYVVVAVVYFVICFSLSMLVRRLRARIAIIR